MDFDDRPRSSSANAGRRLYRDADGGLLFGVCAGLAEYFGFDPTLTRVVVVVAALFSFPMIALAYVALAVLLPKRPRGDGGAGEADVFQRRVRSEPHATLASLRYRFRELDSRLARLEKYVTSQRFKLDMEFHKLKE